MLICFECSRETKDILDRARVETNARDYGELIHEAVSTYELLRKEAGATGSVVVEEGGGSRSECVAGAKGKGRSRGEALGALQVPSAFSRPSKRRAGVAIQPVAGNAPLAADSWLFGQLNRLLPVKASCRALANLSLQNAGPIPLTAGEEIAEDAGLLGDVLRQYDQKMGFGRDDRLSTAFPSRGPDGEKGRIRYATQFVGYADKNGNLSGLPKGLRFIELAGGEPGRSTIALTEPGWEWAMLPNPVLDELATAPTARLSSEEREMLIAHVGEFVPEEVDAYCTLLAAITNGNTTPSKLDRVAIAHSTDEARERLSKSFYSTQRSGAVSRMTDLGLVKREREGSRVFYQTMDRGQRFLEQFCDTTQEGQHD